MTEPTTIFQGDTVTWEKKLSEHPAPDWILEYTAVTESGQETIPTTGSGDTHTVNLTSATTAQWDPGSYRWVAKVRQAATTITVDTGQWDVLVDIATKDSGFDARTHAEKIVDELEAIYERHLTDFGLVSNYSIGDSQYTFSTAEEVYTQLSRARRHLREEQAEERIKRGKHGMPTIKIVM